MSEFNEQCALFVWSRNPAVRSKYPGIDLLEASLNGVHLSKSQAGKAWAAGMLRGALDLNLPVARGKYHGLRIEMKWGKNQMSTDQKWYAGRLVDEGWCVVTCWDWDSARRTIVGYLGQLELLQARGDVCTSCRQQHGRASSKTQPWPDSGAWQDEFFAGANK